MDRPICAVSLSQEWDPKKAGEEVAENLINKMNGEKIDLVLLFSTIHYRTRGGFQKLLDGFYTKVSKETQLIGGTVAGFVIPQGCYTRGVTAFGLKKSELDFSIAVAENIKRNPKLAALKCAAKIKEDLKNSEYKTKFLLNLPSGTTTPKIPGLPDNQRVIKSKFLSKLLILGIKFSLLFMQKGPGREEAIIETLAEELPDYQIIGGSFIDDNKGYFNFQFYNGKVYTNMLITLGITTNYQLSVNSNFGLVERTGSKFKITKKSVYDLAIEEINGKPAFNEIIKVLNWPSYFLEDNRKILRRTFYAPIGYSINGEEYTSIIAFIFGSGVVVSPKVRCEDAYILNTSGKKLLEVVNLNLKDTINKELKFGLMTSCIVRLETMGSSVYKEYDILKSHFGSVPFIQIFVVGEDIYTKKIGAKRIAHSHNSAIFFR